MFDIMRYTKININASSATQVYPDKNQMVASVNTEFIQNCAKRFSKINFIERESGLIFACLEFGRMSWIDAEIMNRMLKQEDVRAGFLAIIPRLPEEIHTISNKQAKPVPEEVVRQTMGNFG